MKFFSSDYNLITHKEGNITTIENKTILYPFSYVLILIGATSAYSIILTFIYALIYVLNIINFTQILDTVPIIIIGISTVLGFITMLIIPQKLTPYRIVINKNDKTLQLTGEKTIFSFNEIRDIKNIEKQVGAYAIVRPTIVLVLNNGEKILKMPPMNYSYGSKLVQALLAELPLKNR